ncbi:class I SAM-dependent methyltransferase [Aquimarina pacifica]|uniref:class I SAM-dependent methyltransferase n=1 Tax=Aquimarina pacifica TaxID=1296415 RepID=UPI00046FDE1C|nr:class I SAM-dependent methyltransferase [Aquimarina pacifica]
MNYFGPKNAAERYAKGRPAFHSTTIERIKKELMIFENVEKALDIACGTGLSTKVLLKIANKVYGTDASEEMLNNAISKDKINYAISKAENQPFLDKEFDIITVCSGVHWFNIDPFLSEANRLLRSNAYLIIYDNFFISEMRENESFKDWFPKTYMHKYPSPKRNNNYDWSTENVKRSRFDLVKEDNFKNEVSFTKDELILYFTTQSNIADAIIRGENYCQIENWLNTELSKFFENETVRKTINFGNWIKYLKRID